MKKVKHGMTFAFALALSGTLAGAGWAAETVYVPIGTGIVAVDPVTDSIRARIEGLAAAHGLAGTPDGGRLIVGSYEEIEVAGEPGAGDAAMAAEEDHSAHHDTAAAAERPDPGADNPALSSVTIVRTADDTIASQFPVAGVVHHVAIDPEGRLAALTHPDEDAIGLIALADYRIERTVPVGSIPNFALFSRDGATLYVTNTGDGTVSVVDVAAGSVRQTVPVGDSPEHMVLSPDGARLYVNNLGDGTVSVVDLGEGAVVAAYAVGEVPHGLDISDDGGTLYLTLLGENRLAAIDLESGAIRKVAMGPSPYHVAVISGHGKLYVSSSEVSELWVVEESSLELLRRIEIGGTGHQMVQLAD